MEAPLAPCPGPAPPGAVLGWGVELGAGGEAPCPCVALLAGALGGAPAPVEELAELVPAAT